VVELRRALPFLAISLLVFVAGCGLLPFGTPVPGGPAGAEIAAHQRQWQQQGVGSYVWQVSFLCECGISGQATITVVDGMVTEATNPAGPLPIDDVASFPLTVDGLFTEALRTLADGGSVDVTWGGPSGLPTSMFLDRDLQAIDDELSVSVDTFEPTP
jgi:hypothetical protein